MKNIKQMDFLKLFQDCRLCPRQCKINRRDDNKQSALGFCKETHRLRVAYVGPHFGEEPPISGENGSGTVFFVGCSLRCSFCQNHQISHKGHGSAVSVEELLQMLENMVHDYNVHNINFVTPDHFFPHVFSAVSMLRGRGFDLPVIYNLSGYQSVEMLNIAENYVDIYLPDFKYSDPSLAARLSKCKDYPGIALEAIAEMIRQKGFLDSCSTGSDIAKTGVLVRHLILPGKIENSINALTSLFLEFGSRLPLSLMSQYHPVVHHKDTDLNRFVSGQEFNRVYSHALALGFEYLFVQFPDDRTEGHYIGSPFLPDFRNAEPFKGFTISSS